MPARVYFPDWLEDVFADLPPSEQDAIFEKLESDPLFPPHVSSASHWPLARLALVFSP
jgi:hypothetical protein